MAAVFFFFFFVANLAGKDARGGGLVLCEGDALRTSLQSTTPFCLDIRSLKARRRFNDTIRKLV